MEQIEILLPKREQVPDTEGGKDPDSTLSVKHKDISIVPFLDLGFTLSETKPPAIGFVYMSIPQGWQTEVKIIGTSRMTTIKDQNGKSKLYVFVNLEYDYYRSNVRFQTR